MYLGETPSAMNVSRVGVEPRLRKSARKPSREIRIVVGAKSDDPLERRTTLDLSEDARDAWYAPKTRRMKKIAMAAEMIENLIAFRRWHNFLVFIFQVKLGSPRTFEVELYSNFSLSSSAELVEASELVSSRPPPSSISYMNSPASSL